MLKIVGFHHYFLKGQEGHEGPKKNNDRVGRGVWEGVGEGKPSPLGFVLEVLGFGGFVAWWVHLHA